ncbi:unnamed protein product [Meganyctiphanes norvegica]|uniref:Uncharacterized protein n=1 Tax=Meganyctiphanes norvegica TaxID=48144 RepID=A0AAV2RJG4_MEGNR
MAPPSMNNRMSEMTSLANSLDVTVRNVVPVSTKATPDTTLSTDQIILGTGDYIYFGIIIALIALIAVGLVVKFIRKKVQVEVNPPQEGMAAVNEAYKEDEDENQRTQM